MTSVCPSSRRRLSTNAASTHLVGHGLNPLARPHRTTNTKSEPPVSKFLCRAVLEPLNALIPRHSPNNGESLDCEDQKTAFDFVRPHWESMKKLRAKLTTTASPRLVARSIVLYPK